MAGTRAGEPRLRLGFNRKLSNRMRAAFVRSCILWFKPDYYIGAPSAERLIPSMTVYTVGKTCCGN